MVSNLPWWTIPGAILVIVGYFSIRGMVGSRNRDVRRVMPVRYWVWRFFTGQHMDGRARTNGTFRYRGTEKVGGIVKATRWQYRAGWERLVIRLICLFLVILIPMAVILDMRKTKGMITLATILYISYYFYRIGRSTLRYFHNKRWINPLHLALFKDIGERRDRKADSYIHIPQKFRSDPEAEGIIELPPGYKQNQSNKQIGKAIGAKLGLTDVEVEVHPQSNRPFIRVFRSPPPPPLVEYVDVTEEIDKATGDSIFLGYGSRRKPVHLTLGSKTPHALMSARTGAGKSGLLKVVLSQELRRGKYAIICDLKRVSHLWAKGLAGVAYCTTIEEIHNALILARDLVDQRYEQMEAANDTGIDVGKGVIVVVEELNSTMTQLQDYWMKRRTSEDPKKSPAIEAFDKLAFMGRAADVHIIVLGVYVTVRSLGGGSDTRENFAVRILAQHTTNAWRMLVPEHWPPPKAKAEPGRVFVAIGDEVIETQVVNMSDNEARELARKGLAPPPLEVEKAPDTAEIPMMATLREACEWEWIPIKYATARQRKSREGDRFPKGSVNSNGETVYSRIELEDWYYKRQTTE